MSIIHIRVQVQVQCCIPDCLKIRGPDGHWVKGPGYKLPDASHGLCPPCGKKEKAKARRFVRARASQRR